MVVLIIVVVELVRGLYPNPPGPGARDREEHVEYRDNQDNNLRMSKSTGVAAMGPEEMREDDTQCEWC